MSCARLLCAPDVTIGVIRIVDLQSGAPHVDQLAFVKPLDKRDRSALSGGNTGEASTGSRKDDGLIVFNIDDQGRAFVSGPRLDFPTAREAA
jgi:hypothetical protein